MCTGKLLHKYQPHSCNAESLCNRYRSHLLRLLVPDLKKKLLHKELFPFFLTLITLAGIGVANVPTVKSEVHAFTLTFHALFVL